ncbi:hypothetical protein DSL72_002377 [Monilinia vaccinii-corymbosi]|uniref:Uncharacterized protein n=1 Tax=Monilinia vaccinii-corymbosi TaxID=61207 RepID=A0A8A3PCI9_9HELO|nr:hypothetical protein DSL72_002377 [Monilinia vaccinii-corymbosi]
MNRGEDLSRSGTRHEIPVEFSTNGSLGALEITKKADELGLMGGLGLDVVRLVVGVRTREFLATGDGGSGCKREELLDTNDVIWADDSRDIKVSQATPGIEANFSEHAFVVGSAGRPGKKVADPLVGEGLDSCAVAADGDRCELVAFWVGCEDDGAGGVVLVDEVNGAGRGDACEGCDSGKNGGCELHLE